MAYIIIEGDPGQLEHLLGELYDRHYLPNELHVKLIDDDDLPKTMKLSADLETFNLLKAIIEAINDEWHPAFREPTLTADELELLESAEAVIEAQV